MEFTAGWRDEVDAFVTEWLSDERLPGAAVAVTDGDATRYAEGYGARDLESNAPADPDTRYGVASVTKSFAALAVLRQVERGGVALDDPITDYLDLYDGAADPPTVADLLSHGSGMVSDGASVALISRAVGADGVEVPLSSDADLARHVDGSLADRDSERRFHYYNTGYTALGRLVAELDGRSFADYVADEVLAPLGMDRSVVAPDDLGENAMTPYREEDGSRVACPFPAKGVGAAGGLVSTASDLARYLRFQTDPDPAVVDADLLAEAHAGHTVRQAYLDGTEQAYGYGWMSRPFRGDTLVEHGGSLGVSTAYVGFLADAGIGVALATNGSPDAHPQFVGPALLALLDGGDPTDTRFYAHRAAASRVAGTYESYRDVMTATVEPDGARIEVSLETALGGESLVAVPVSDDPDDLRYRTVAASGAEVPLAFERDDEGLSLIYQRWRLRRA